MKRSAILGCILVLVPLLAFAQAGVFLREDFNDLANWRPVYFPNIAQHTRYAIASEGAARYLRADSRASASGLVLEKQFDVYAYPGLRWRWKVDNLYRRGDARTKAGDDYPLRICVVFGTDPDSEGAMEFLKRRLGGLVSGEDPPHSSIEYVWANRGGPENILDSPYTDRVKMILVQKGAAKLGRWLEEEVDVVRDYERAFGRKPPTTARLAIMNDSDNTGEASTSGVDWIEIFR